MKPVAGALSRLGRLLSPRPVVRAQRVPAHPGVERHPAAVEDLRAFIRSRVNSSAEGIFSPRRGVAEPRTRGNGGEEPCCISASAVCTPLFPERHMPHRRGRLSDPDRDRSCDLAFRKPSSEPGQHVSGGLTTLKTSQADVSEVLNEPTKSLPFVHTLVHQRLLTLDQVADYLAVTRSLVDDLVGSGALRVLRIGPERRVRFEDLEAFLRLAEK